MCGFICLIKYGGVFDSCSPNECLQKLHARGPDNYSQTVFNIFDSDNKHYGQVYMGFSRLAIMDTSDAGLQPFMDENNNTVICNGEIYNYCELISEYGLKIKSNCDCEVLLPLIKKFGFDNVVSDYLDAEFAMVYMDRENNILYAARDRYGVRPLYYGYNKSMNLVGFASELKALHDVMEFVEQVKPNEIFKINLKGMFNNPFDVELNDPLEMPSCLKRFEYFSYENLTTIPSLNNPDILMPIIRNLLTKTVEKRLNSDRPIGFLLSGGLDSSLIVSIASRIKGPSNITCFSIGIDGSPDVEAAKLVVEFLGIPKENHHIIPFTPQQGLKALPTVIKTIETYDVTTIRASTPQFLMAKYINENTNIKVLLSGEGSDEIHGSYRYFRDAPDPEEFHNETIRLLKELCYFDNQRTDRTMSGNGLEVRIPFLDIAYVDFITRIDPVLLMYRPDYMEKKIIRDSFKGYLPDEILYRSKEAFSDAVSNKEINWAESIKEAAKLYVIEDELKTNDFEINSPRTLDALYFREIFDSIYPGRCNIIPHYWLPRFQKTEVLDPSATVLECY